MQYAKLSNQYEIEKEMLALDARMQGAMRFLKKHSLQKQNNKTSLYKLPWYLMLGPKASGKTTLLANSDVPFVLRKQMQQEQIKDIQSSKTCDWWVTNDIVILDVPGSYIHITEHTMEVESLFDRFLNLCHKYMPQRKPEGIILTLSLSDLISDFQKNDSISSLKQIIKKAQAKFGSKIPFQLIITKGDLLPGFTDFFSEYSNEELSQIWGVTFPHVLEDESLSDLFLQRFDELLKKLNQQMIWRLHQERNLHAKALIKDFPLHVENLKDVIFHFLKYCFNENDMSLQGIFLTSAIQHDVSDQTTQYGDINLGDQQALQILKMPVMPSRSFFVRHLITYGLSVHQIIADKKRKHSLLVSTSAAATFLVAIFLSAFFYHKNNENYVMLAKQTATLTQDKKNNLDLSKALKLINKLEQTEQS